MSAKKTLDEVTHSLDNVLQGGGIEYEKAYIEEAHIESDGEIKMPQLDPSSFASQIFWLVVTFTLLYILISRSALPRIHEIIEKRRHRIERDLIRAEKLSEEAEQAKKSYESMQRKAREEANTLISEPVQQLQEEHETEFSRIDSDIVVMLGEADSRIKEKRDAFKEELVSLSEELAGSLVKELTGKSANASTIKSAVKAQS